MYRTILVPLALDHGLSDTLFATARRLCAEDGQIHALHVVEAAYGIAQATQEANYAKAAVDRARALLRSRVAQQTDLQSHLIEGHVYRSILDFAGAHGVDCIVMGSHRPGLSDYLIGSTAARVVRHANCAVHVHRAL